MKKIYVILAVMFAFVVGASTNSNAYNFTGHSENDTCGGVSYNFTFNTASGALSDTTYFGDGTHAAGYLYGTQGYVYHAFSSPGIYTVKHILYLSGAPVDSLIFSDTIMCKLAYIEAYLDVNSNCAWNTGEPFLTTPVAVEIDSAGVKIDTITMIGGAYRPLTVGKTYSMKLLNLPPGLSVTCPSSGIVTVTVAASGATVYSFGLTCGTASSSFDVSENVSVRTGRHSFVVDILVNNNSCTPKTVTLTANLSTKYGTFISAYPTPTTSVGNVLTWTLPNVSAFAGYHVTIHYETGTSTSSWLTPGDTVHTSFYVTPTTGDSNPANNSVVRVDTVISSYDPNYKSVYPSGNIAAGAALEYSIEFENDGNAAALNIHILDTLSGNLDVNSLKMRSSSAPVTNIGVLQSGAYNILRFDLPGINLPDSSHHGQCTGMVVFSINAKSGLAKGTVITNKAGIYFDDNPVVMTNSAQNQIPVPSGVNTIVPEVSLAYPNPVHDVLNIKADGNFQAALIVNTLGQTVMEKNISGKTTMDVSQLANGIYYLILKGQQETKVQKIEKQ